LAQVDPNVDFYPEVSPYIYCHDNPVDHTDSDGADDDDDKTIYGPVRLKEILVTAPRYIEPDYSSAAVAAIALPIEGEGWGAAAAFLYPLGLLYAIGQAYDVTPNGYSLIRMHEQANSENEGNKEGGPKAIDWNKPPKNPEALGEE
jgi:hypothetical protein